MTEFADLGQQTPVAGDKLLLLRPTGTDTGNRYQMDIGNLPDKQWLGKKFLAVGDSITAASNAWAEDCSALLGTTLTKIATSGWNTSDAYTAVAAANTSDKDLIMVLIGTNDFGNDTAMGAPGDDHSDSTFYGYYNDLILACLNDNKQSRLMLITPFHRSGDTTANSQSKTLRDYCDTIVALGRANGVPVYDAYDDIGFGPTTLSTFLSDGLHPNSDGNIWAAKRIARYADTI